MASSLSALALAASATLAAQEPGVLPDLSYPQFPGSAASVPGFVPAGWRLEAEARGDLDGDGRADVAFILRGTDPAGVVPVSLCGERLDTNLRVLAVAVAKPGGGYRLADDDAELIPRATNPCAADVLEEGGIAIRDGVLRVTLYRFYSMGSWETGTNAFAFRLDEEGLRLVGYDYFGAVRNSGETYQVSVNYLTGRAKLTTGRIDSDRETDRWVDLHHRRRLAVHDIGDGTAFDPEHLVSGHGR